MNAVRRRDRASSPRSHRRAPGDNRPTSRRSRAANASSQRSSRRSAGASAIPGCHGKLAAGGIGREQHRDSVRAGRCRSSPGNCSRSSAAVIGPVLPAMSLVPAMMCTALRPQRDDVAHHPQHHLRLVWPPMPRSIAAAREEAGTLVVPAFGDRIAHEDDVDRLAATRAAWHCPRHNSRSFRNPGAASRETTCSSRRREADAAPRAAAAARRTGEKRRRSNSHQIVSSNEQTSGRSAPSGATPASLNRTWAGLRRVKRGHCGRPAPLGSPVRMKFSQ